MTQCYACESDATSKEHIPPRCIFPKGSENDEQPGRVNLITVNSCAIHNTEKSGDDQLFFHILAMSRALNNKPQAAVRPRFSRGITRRPALAYSIIERGYCNADGEFVGKVNGARLDAYLSLMGRGLEFFRSGRSVNSEMITVASSFLAPTDPQIRETNRRICELLDGLELTPFGPDINRETFYCEYAEDEMATVLKATFYENLVICWVINK